MLKKLAQAGFFNILIVSIIEQSVTYKVFIFILTLYKITSNETRI